MITPGAMALAMITVMLWILWSDTIRARKPTPILYAIRIALYLIVSGVMTVNMVRHPEIFSASTRVVSIIAAVIGILGAAYFARKLTALGRRTTQ